MIFYILVFLLIVTASLYLAYLSMKDVYEVPEKGRSYAAFLISNPAAFTKEILKELRDAISEPGLIISLERLYKGDKSALVIYGPKPVLKKLDILKLVEIEDYTKVKKEEISAEDLKKMPNIPTLSEDEQFWLQFVLQSKSNGFKSHPRAVHISGVGEKKEDSLKIFRDYQKRLIAPLSTDIFNFNEDELLRAILKP